VASIERRGRTVTPGAAVSTTSRVSPSAGSSAVRAATTIHDAVCASGTNSFSPWSSQASPLRRAGIRTPPASQRPLSSTSATVACAEPFAIDGSSRAAWAASPLAATVIPARPTEDTKGEGIRWRPISSSTTVRSTRPSPSPPCASAKGIAVQPNSAIRA
jgi:hypothetical protein